MTIVFHGLRFWYTYKETFSMVVILSLFSLSFIAIRLTLLKAHVGTSRLTDQ